MKYHVDTIDECTSIWRKCVFTKNKTETFQFKSIRRLVAHSFFARFSSSFSKCVFMCLCVYPALFTHQNPFAMNNFGVFVVAILKCIHNDNLRWCREKRPFSLYPYLFFSLSLTFYLLGWWEQCIRSHPQYVSICNACISSIMAVNECCICEQTMSTCMHVDIPTPTHDWNICSAMWSMATVFVFFFFVCNLQSLYFYLCRTFALCSFVRTAYTHVVVLSHSVDWLIYDPCHHRWWCR